MTVLGYGGTLHFNRATPAALELTTGDRRETSNTFQPSGHSLWTGDFVSLSGAKPVSPYLETCFVHVDRLHRISLYTSKAEALMGSRENRAPVPDVDAFPLTMVCLTPEIDISTEVSTWTLHTDPAYLNPELVELQLGAAMLNACAGGGQLSFIYTATHSRRFSTEITTIYKLLECSADLNAKLQIKLENKIALEYVVNVKPLSFVINTRELPRIDGTLDFASLVPPQLMHS